MDTRLWSYTTGISAKPLLGVTIGDMFNQIGVLFPLKILRSIVFANSFPLIIAGMILAIPFGQQRIEELGLDQAAPMKTV